MLNKLKSSIDAGLVILVFTHIRNYLICITIIAAGFFALENQQVALLGLPILFDKFAGLITILLGLMLALLNLYDAIYRLSRMKFHLVLNFLLVGIYIFVTLRIFEVLWHFKSAF
jgi:hypothetical protein